MGERNGDAFGYAEFGAWYDTYRFDVLEPALDRALGAIQDVTHDALSDRDLARLRSISGRVKSKRRLWRKVSQPRYRALIPTVDDIPAVIDDLVGLRLTCTNLRDIELVQLALETLPRRASKRRPLTIDRASERDYVEQPKESGYRGWHVNLGVLHEGTPVTVELQVRTLLQDSWGELTHEDTYSKAGELPPLVEVLSARMADLLATLDDIAEDLRNELDRIDRAIVTETATAPDDPDASAAADDDPMTGVAADAADVLQQHWRDGGKPVELAALAWELQNEFGAEVSDDWFGFRTFKRFLRHAVPDGEISTGDQAFLLPAPSNDRAVSDADAGAATTDEVTIDDPSTAGHAVAAGTDGDVPDAVLRLRSIDRGFPLIETDQWTQVYAQLAAAWRRIGRAEPDNRMINRLTRSARDSSSATGEPVSRRHLDYVAKAVLAGSTNGEPMTAAAIGDTFATWTLQRMADLRIVGDSDAPRRTAIARFLLAT